MLMVHIGSCSTDGGEKRRSRKKNRKGIKEENLKQRVNHSLKSRGKRTNAL